MIYLGGDHSSCQASDAIHRSKTTLSNLQHTYMYATHYQQHRQLSSICMTFKLIIGTYPYTHSRLYNDIYLWNTLLHTDTTKGAHI